MALIRRPLAALLRRQHGRHRAHRVHPAPERIECRHGLMRCDHCNPLWTAKARPSALSIATKPYPIVTVRGGR